MNNKLCLLVKCVVVVIVLVIQDSTKNKNESNHESFK